MLLGEFEQRLDDKNRVTIPARHRERFGDGVWLTRGLDGCLAVYPRAGWDQFVAERTARLDPFSGEARKLERYLFSGAAETEMDRQGRVAVPPALMKHANLRRDVVVAGVRDRLEIWDREAWTRALEEFEGSAERVAERLAKEPAHS